MKLASNHRNIFEALLDAYAEIGNALPRFNRYASTFKDNPEFHSILAGIYSAIFEFHQRAYKLFQRRGKLLKELKYQNLTFIIAWHLIFLSLWKDFRARFQGIINTIEKHRDFIDKEADSIDMVKDRAARTRILDDIEERQRQTAALLDSNDAQKRLVQLQSSISWLAVDDKRQETERSRRSTMRHSRTFKWIKQVPKMKSWLTDDNSEPSIWLNGKPGAGISHVLSCQYFLGTLLIDLGKSVMCASILEFLGKFKSLNAYYYFCNNQDNG
jgi:hypothetical protein